MRGFLNRRKSGQAAVETVMAMLMFVMMLGTVLSLSLYVYMNHTFLTAAQQGARTASMDGNFANASTQSAGITDVQTAVKNFVSSSTSIQLANSNIVVTGPTGAVIGNRTMTVAINYTFKNPVPVRGFMAALSGSKATGLDNFTITDQATMHYEE